jgi:hypothetical protein
MDALLYFRSILSRIAVRGIFNSVIFSNNESTSFTFGNYYRKELGFPTYKKEINTPFRQQLRAISIKDPVERRIASLLQGHG